MKNTFEFFGPDKKLLFSCPLQCARCAATTSKGARCTKTTCITNYQH